jgi:N-acetylneuraminate lyase
LSEPYFVCFVYFVVSSWFGACTVTPHPPLVGLVPAVLTPFAPDGELNLAAVERQAELALRDGVSAVFVGGTTGEFASLTVPERQALARRWADVTRGTPLRVVVHVGSNCLADARALAAQAEELRAAAISAVAPSYFKPKTVDDLAAWCAEVAAAAPATPFYFYDIPAMTGVALPMPEFVDAAADRVPTLAGLKFSNPDLAAFQRLLRLRDGRFDVVWGTDEYLLAALVLGGEGAVGSTYNFLAEFYHGIIQKLRSGNLVGARQDQSWAAYMISRLHSYGFLAACKEAMRMVGVDCGRVRLPNRNLTAEQATALGQELGEMGFPWATT